MNNVTPTISAPHTTSLRTRIRHIRNLLATDFPNTFFREGDKRPRKAFKIGIARDIAESGFLVRHGISYFEIQAVLDDIAKGTRYLTAVALGGMRHDLQGAPVEPILEKHRSWAETRLSQLPPDWLIRMKIKQE